MRIHSGNGQHQEMDERAIACFDQALTDIALREDDPVRPVLHDYFAWATTSEHLPLRPVPGRRARGPAHPPLVMGGPGPPGVSEP